MANKRTWVVAGVTAVVVVVLLFTTLVIGGAAAFAQTPTPPARNPGAALQNLGELFWQKLATRLNVTVDKLHQEVNGAVQDTLQQEVQDGKLTQEQAQRLQNQANKRIVPGFGIPGFGQPFGKPQPGRTGGIAPWGMSQSMLDAVGKILGMTTDEVRQALQNGQSLGQLADSKNVSRDAVVQVIRNALKSEVDQMLSNKRISQEQADQMKARIDAQAIDLNNTRLNPSIQPGQRFKFGPNQPSKPRQRFQ